MKDYKKEAKDIIASNIYMTIATSSLEGGPWISPVFFAYDDEYNLYWVSEKISRHSQLIRENARVAIVIFDPSAPEGKGDGVYFEAEAFEINNSQEAERTMSILGARATQGEFKIKRIGEVTEGGVWRVYKAIPKRISKLTDGEYINGQYVDRRVEIDLMSEM